MWHPAGLLAGHDSVLAHSGLVRQYTAFIGYGRHVLHTGDTGLVAAQWTRETCSAGIDIPARQRHLRAEGDERDETATGEGAWHDQNE